MTVRLVTATRGTSRHLDATVQSIQHAAPAAAHVVVAPHGGLSSSESEVAKYTLLREDRPGLYPSLNVGAAHGPPWEYVSWLNDDDVLVAPGFSLAGEVASQEADADVVYGRVTLIDVRGHRLGELPVARTPRDLPRLLAGGIVPFAQPGTMIRRRLWERLGGVDESYELAGDLDFFVRALVRGAKFVFVDAEVASFRLSAGQLSKRRAQMQAETERALRPLRHIKPSRLALWRFRWQNLPVYIDRLRRHGWVSMQELSDRTQ